MVVPDTPLRPGGDGEAAIELLVSGYEPARQWQHAYEALLHHDERHFWDREFRDPALKESLKQSRANITPLLGGDGGGVVGLFAPKIHAQCFPMHARLHAAR